MLLYLNEGMTLKPKEEKMTRKLLICSIALLVGTIGIYASPKRISGSSNTAGYSPAVKPDINPGGMILIRGKVTDQKGLPLKNITVTIQTALGGEAQRTKTSGDGSYRFRLKSPEKPGFRNQIKMIVILKLYRKAHLIRQEIVKFDMKKPIVMVTKNIAISGHYRMYE